MLRKKAFIIGMAASLALLGAGTIGSVALAGSAVPGELDQSLDRETRSGAFHVRIAPAERPIPLYRIHRWTVVVTDREGRPVSGAAIRVDGGMPQHGHGLPTQPVATAADGAGRYAVNGVKFSMNGWWEFKLDISVNGVTDGVTFNIVL